MKRRELLRLLASGAALQLAPAQWAVVWNEARALLASRPTARTLNAHQEATVTAITEMILPRTGTPGAADVGATAFIDLFLTEWYDEADRKRFLTGIADVDARSKTLFGHDFVDGQAVQRAQILMELGQKMVHDGAGVNESAIPNGKVSIDTDFYAMLRRLTLTAYYTSEAGATEELHFEIIPGSYEGCATRHSEKETPKQP